MVTKKVAATKSAPKAKKAPAKKSGANAKRVLARAEGAQCFWVNDGQILADLVEFGQALDQMEKDTFGYHVQGKRNDFADWVEFVLGDTELAHLLRGATSPSKARTIVVRRLKIYGV